MCQLNAVAWWNAFFIRSQKICSIGICHSCLKTVLYCDISLEGKIINQTVHQDWASEASTPPLPLAKKLSFSWTAFAIHLRDCPCTREGPWLTLYSCRVICLWDIPLSTMFTASIWYALCRDKNSFVFQEQGMFTLRTWSILLKCLSMCSKAEFSFYKQAFIVLYCIHKISACK